MAELEPGSVSFESMIFGTCSGKEGMNSGCKDRSGRLTNPRQLRASTTMPLVIRPVVVGHP